MAINKKLIHFNKKATFNSQKLSANDSNTQYQVGGTGTVQTGAPDINYQSIVYIKDSKEIWTHGQFYATAVTWSTITGKPSFATVATSGSYNDLNNKPTIPTKLPTPNALTFTGAVTGTWDGSSAKTVNIPSGSSYTLPLASNRTRGGIKLSSSTQGGTPNGITTTPGRTYAVQVNSNEQAVVNVPWTDTTYTLPTASSSTLGGVKVGSGLSISSGVLSTSSIPEAFSGYWYKVAGVKVGESGDLKATSNLTYKVGGSGSSTTASLIIGDIDGDNGGPGNISTGVHINVNNEDGIHTITTEGKLSITSSTNDLELSSDSSSGFVKVSSHSGDIKMSNTGNGSQITFHIDEDVDSYSELQLGTSNSNGVNVVQMTLGGVNKEAHFFGAVSSPGGFFDTSDARVKTNVVEIDASKADAVRLVEFDRTDKKHHGYGVIAQELEKVYPEMVNTDSEGFKSVNYNELAMVKIKYLEDKVARLEALVGRLLAE